MPTLSGEFTCVINPSFPSNVVVTADWITTPFDTIPNFPIGNGFIVPVGETRIWDGIDDFKYDTIRIEGTLLFANNPTRLRVTNLMVMPGGSLVAGTAANPITAKCEIIVNDVPLLASDTNQYGNGFLVFGNVSLFGSPHSDYHVKLATEPKAGDTSITLAVPVTGWNPGDKIVLPDSRQYTWGMAPWDNGAWDSPYTTWTEMATIASVSGDVIHLAAPLGFDHLGGRDPDGILVTMPDVGLLTHNVQIKSENPVGTRGHGFVTRQATFNGRNFQLSGLGRTKIDQISATNIKGRYPLHFHHPVTQPVIDGFSIFCPMNTFVYRWGMAIHDTHNGTFRNGVIYNWAGAGICIESGSETGNIVESNFICHVNGPEGTPDSRPNYEVGFEGVAIWSASLKNHIRNNIIADCRIGIDYVNQGIEFPDLQATILEDRGNETYGGLLQTARYLWNQGMWPDRWNTDPNMAESVIKDWTCWHVSSTGFYNYQSNHLTFDGLLMLGDTELVRSNRSGPKGFYAGDYIQQRFKIVNSSIQGMGVGIYPSSIGEEQTIENTFMRNYANVRVTPPWWLDEADKLIMTRTITLKNVTEESLGVPERLDWLGHVGHVVMDPQPGMVNQNPMALTKVLIYQHNGDPTANFRVYYNEAKADYVLAEAKIGDNGQLAVNGPPEAGLTNAQAWAKYGMAFGGAVAPATAVVKTDFTGLVEAL